MTRKTALRRMLAVKMVYHPDKPDNPFRYDDNQTKTIYPIFIREFGNWFLGLTDFFELPNTGWKEYRPEEKCQNKEQSS